MESNNLILPQINTKLKSPVDITSTLGHPISLYEIAPNLHNLSSVSSALLETLFYLWKNNDAISLNTFEQQLFTFK